MNIIEIMEICHFYQTLKWNKKYNQKEIFNYHTLDCFNSKLTYRL